MSSSKTSNYQLNQWVKSDRVLMEEFNADNAKIDAALASKASASALSSLQSAVNGKASASSVTSLSQTVSQGLALRNCRFVTGSYTGDGTYGEAHPNTLTFPYEPAAVFITGAGMQMNLVNGQDSFRISSEGNSSITITWGERSVTWYVRNTSNTSSAPYHQMNGQSTDYHYFAVLEIA